MARKKEAKKSKKTKNPSKSKEAKNQNKVLRNVFITLGVIALIFLIGYVVVYNATHFKYENVEFEVVTFCDVKPCLILYQTKLPVVMENGEKAEYNFYLRTDPRDLKDVEFDGDINFLSTIVINSDNDFNCGGDGIIAAANLVKLYEIIGISVIKNEERKCDLDGNYIFIDIQEGERTRIVQPVSSCYVFRVNDCEILPVMEKFMVETFVKVNNELI